MDQNRKEYLMQASPFEALFARLAQSDFRSRFRLGPEEDNSGYLHPESGG